MCSQAAGGLATLGIIAGSGSMPRLLAEDCARRGRPYFVLALDGCGADAWAATHPHGSVRLAAIGDALKQLKKAGVQEAVMAGQVKRPTLSSLKPDLTATMLLAKLGTKIFSGDDALLSVIMSFLEDNGIKVVGASDVCAELLAKPGAISAKKPSRTDHSDIERGISVAAALGALDVGQAVIVENGYVLAVEAAEGTEAMIARAGSLAQHEAGKGVLVKAKKPGQDARADLPTIGKDTIEQLTRAGFAGVAVQAGGSLILDAEEVTRLAGEHGLFVFGFEYE